jgi:hypothetical protein
MASSSAAKSTGSSSSHSFCPSEPPSFSTKAVHD